ncbi:pimeloyl-ACP methyl ester carboxylesterase [Naumannella halotolerans]|uniref:Pimeloyl-ACP methyl ester carboxylesterase n=1 Tax=Naumannella halotolerans TaxID=993414 RepID=A0A4R7J960_9ACTN|nr:pimeloyl-ACP methyl ester carboxylesterase [Naumannella halotolerans]
MEQAVNDLPQPDLVLIPGLWLPAEIWQPVVTELAAVGVAAHPVELPGQGASPPDALLDDQLAAVLEVVDGLERPIVVGHSAASGLAWLVADRRPDAITAVVLIGGFPPSDGAVYADFIEPRDGVVGFPGWEPFEGPDADDLDQQQRAHIEELAVPVSAGVTKAPVRLGDRRRHDVPVVLVCPEFSPGEAQAWIDAGDLPELAAAKNLQLLDLRSGHWPMVSCPADLLRGIDRA